MDEYTLRNVLKRAKRLYELMSETGQSYWTTEGIPWAILDYHSSKGSLDDFTEDDWAAAAEHGWSCEEVEELCKQD